ncbi:FAD-dependent oxidoreductase [Parapedobacter sp. 10938]|uniref:FAD-dependent oxidoreductase n=1 Tax=Parapedobacter flavus TaxID=3110225 RepID=UPI002DBDFEAA|nr:FAD-dependent oxidoreductase [Parapedobacter sp. 10938]MEC3880035.1 FAD-dependent oxidoreductase [Parapedobacter sp. 10938]
MRRRNFLETLAVSSGLFAVAPLSSLSAQAAVKQIKKSDGTEQLEADVVIAGGGLGGFAAAMAALRNGQSVIMTEETDWIGGQLTQQGVPPDEHAWIETTGATQLYRDFRNGVRNYYRRNYPLTETAMGDPLLNPGNGAVSRLCHEPRVALAVLTDMLNPYLSTGQLTLLLEHKVTAADTDDDRVKAIHVRESRTGAMKKLAAPFFVDATELGDLLPLTGTEFVTGTESKTDTDELHAPEKADPSNNQAFTMCFAMDYVPGEDHTIKKPDNYAFWRNHVPNLTPPWPGRLLELHYSNPKTLQPKKLGFDPRGEQTGDALNLWNYRKIISKDNFVPGTYPGDISLVNWPQNDYMLGNIVGVSEEEFDKHVTAAKALSLSLLYWLQTEAPRPDGGKGWPGLRLRKDVMGTADGLAKYPYVRESRRIKALFTIREEHVGKANRQMVAQTEKDRAAEFSDSVGIGYYHIDLHPSSNRVNYVDFDSLRFQIPLGALLPIRMKNLLPANKNIGTTHITNGCYRLHPVEWSIGEAVGLLISYARKKALTPAEVRKEGKILADFQSFIRSQGVETAWPTD